MAQHNEIAFEKEIAEYLAEHGWLYSTSDAGYDRERALFPEDVLGWLEDTQPEQLEKVVKPGSKDIVKQQAQLLDRVVKVLDTPLDNGGGTLNVLRKGFSHLSAKFAMCVFEPESTLNAKRNADYAAVRLRVMRQVHFSTADRRSVDLVFFVNGLPVATAELKTDFTQTIADAVNQYKTRLPKDFATGKAQPLFESGARALVHFAVSNDEVWMTTRLAGEKTHFLPFNRGTEAGGAGNPLNPNGSRTSYLWERVFQRDAWLNILGRLMYIKHEATTDPISGKTTKSSTLRFPRFHQWEAVTELTAAVTTEGVGKRYLIQHSAGSGKTDSIAWTAHRMARLQVENKKVFDSVIVVTDRNVLDAQLQDAIKQIDNDAGIVVAIDRDEAAKAGGSKSGLLAKALTDGKLIIVVTIQTFPFAMEEIRKNKGLNGKTFAVIADEAHSSQSGQTAAQLKAVLTAEELQEIEEGGEIDVEAILAAEATERAASANISYFAFTATPKAKTLELFGREPAPGENPVPFHVYTMRQAIEEGYILDVLSGYHSFKLAFQIGQNAGGGEDVDQSEATKAVMKWVKLNPQTISQKSAIIVEHFRENVAQLLDGHAKAMVVTDSRKAAVRYKLAIDDYIAKKGYGYGTLVAFSGTVHDPESGPDDFSETTMNPGVRDLRTAFNGDDRQIMIVANKFQTGFDQPLLCAMYVDRILSGVTAVQTLSRLNRTYRTPSGVSKTAAMTQVVDFVNEPAAIREAFEPYFTDAYLETATDPNLVHDLSAKLDTAGIYTQAEVDQCAEAFVKGKGNSALAGAVGPGQKRFAERYTAALIHNGGEGDKAALAELDMFRKDVGSFVRLYDFMSQIVDYGDPELEKKQIYLRLLERFIQSENYTAPIDLSDVVLKKVTQVDRGKVDIGLGTRVGLVGMTAAGSGEKRDPTMVALQQVLDRLNDLFGSEDFTTAQKESFLESLLQTLLDDHALVQQAKVNSAKQFVESPDFDDAVTGAVADNHGAHEKMSDYFFTNAPGREHLISDIAKWFYQVVSAEGSTA
ncbi:type I restriction endonuclease subunit R [Mycolicibacterium brumae]|uniref:Type I restriction endonuclease subunit R n=1 Tax=Mycolicibacterium brumae TaxID=85968 RepID=A0A2G5P5Q7_9MYCO|nr:type I restriction endonuclease [Mycolicibacterium brumae]MCV7192219.1 type I restriction endonuclease subunit R [Mycolicibacterium brumae]PIB73363.1 type I restriction endonuclease subunit R [Mycolicibacterium brumae]RWA18105.1 type I restriction-modification system R subunit [Mycolicibacterium brumae DSM 44177]UWW10654.1 DEAD/DEAH box helicase family protein [Mycolicibacterium brumae]